MFQRRKKGFTLLELIVVIVILGLLAALAIPTFSRVIDRSKDETAGASLSSIARNAQALTAFQGQGFKYADVESAVSEVAYSATAEGLWAADTFTMGADSAAVTPGGEGSKSESYGEVGWALSSDSGTIGLSMRSTTERCVYVKAQTSSSTTWAVSKSVPEECSSDFALTITPGQNGETVDPENPDDTENPGTPSTPTDFAGLLDVTSFSGGSNETVTFRSTKIPAGTSTGETPFDIKCETDVPLKSGDTVYSADDLVFSMGNDGLTGYADGYIPSEGGSWPPVEVDPADRVYTCDIDALNDAGEVISSLTLSDRVGGTPTPSEPSSPQPGDMGNLGAVMYVDGANDVERTENAYVQVREFPEGADTTDGIEGSCTLSTPYPAGAAIRTSAYYSGNTATFEVFHGTDSPIPAVERTYTCTIVVRDHEGNLLAQRTMVGQVGAAVVSVMPGTNNPGTGGGETPLPTCNYEPYLYQGEALYNAGGRDPNIISGNYYNNSTWRLEASNSSRTKSYQLFSLPQYPIDSTTFETIYSDFTATSATPITVNFTTDQPVKELRIREVDADTETPGATHILSVEEVEGLHNTYRAVWNPGKTIQGWDVFEVLLESEQRATANVGGIRVYFDYAVNNPDYITENCIEPIGGGGISIS